MSYIGIFKSKEDVFENFDVEKQDRKNIDILLAFYEYKDYSGDAFVLFHKDGKYYEVNGTHCSCHGLEEQWSPEETTLEVLEHRVEKGKLGQNNWNDRHINTFAEELKVIIHGFNYNNKFIKEIE